MLFESQSHSTRLVLLRKRVLNTLTAQRHHGRSHTVSSRGMGNSQPSFFFGKKLLFTVRKHSGECNFKHGSHIPCWVRNCINFGCCSFCFCCFLISTKIRQWRTFFKKLTKITRVADDVLSKHAKNLADRPAGSKVIRTIWLGTFFCFWVYIRMSLRHS